MAREAGQSVQTYFSLLLAPTTGNKEKYGWPARLDSDCVCACSCAGMCTYVCESLKFAGGTMVVMVPLQYFQFMNCEGSAMQ